VRRPRSITNAATCGLILPLSSTATSPLVMTNAQFRAQLTQLRRRCVAHPPISIGLSVFPIWHCAWTDAPLRLPGTRIRLKLLTSASLCLLLLRWLSLLRRRGFSRCIHSRYRCCGSRLWLRDRVLLLRRLCVLFLCCFQCFLLDTWCCRRVAAFIIGRRCACGSVDYRPI
jgi:hypothetical protein